MPNETSTAPAPDALARRHEARDPSAAKIAASALLVVAMILVSFIIVTWLITAWTRQRPGDLARRMRGTIIAPDDQLLKRFPAPNLQLSPQDDLAAFEAAERAELNTYGWVNRTAGIVRIPIARAMELTVERGLPVRPTNGPAHTGKSEFELIRERPEQK